MEKFIALLFSGVTEGAVIALAAVGLLVLFKATGVINFAHGDLITLGAYFGVWLMTDHGWAYVPGVIVALLLMFLVGAAFERITVAPLRGRSVHVIVIATLGLAVAMRSLIAIWKGADPQRLTSPMQSSNTEIFGANINHHRFLIVAVAGVVLTVIIWIFANTRFGRQVRALAADREMARLSGIRAPLLSMAAFGISAVLAGLAGILIAPLSVAELTLGFGVMLNSFSAMIIGGFGSLRGVAIAAMMIGLLERLVGGYVLTDYSEALPFAFMIFAIAYKPEGLFGGEVHAARL